jgi:hypothetical protein
MSTRLAAYRSFLASQPSKVTENDEANSEPPTANVGLVSPVSPSENEGETEKSEQSQCCITRITRITEKTVTPERIGKWRDAIAAIPPANTHVADKLVDRALTFLDGSAAVAAIESGWDDISLFGISAGQDWATHGAAWGLISWLAIVSLQHGAITFNGETAIIETSGACVLTHMRFQPARDCAVPFWEHKQAGGGE